MEIEMIDSLKRSIAQKLCPDVFENAEKWEYARSQMEQCRTYCSYDFPIVGEALAWVLKSVWIHFMPANEYISYPADKRYPDLCVDRVDMFREDLRHRFPRRIEPTTAAASDPTP